VNRKTRDRYCVITGASGTIGRAIADALLQDSYVPLAIGRSRPTDWQGEFFECDLSQEAEIELVCNQLASEVPRVWGLINSAGQAFGGELQDLTNRDLSQLLQLNTVAPALLARGITPLMAEGGRIVSISSTTAYGKRGRSAYAASKAGLNALSACWALELGPRNITSNVVAAGPVESPVLRSAIPAGSERERVLLEQIPTGRFTQPQEVAALVLYLLSFDAANITGQAIRLDGGLSAGAFSQ